MTTRERIALSLGIVLDLFGLLVFLNAKAPEATRQALRPPAIIESAHAAVPNDRTLFIP
jgi:hypothetical protein